MKLITIHLIVDIILVLILFSVIYQKKKISKHETDLLNFIVDVIFRVLIFICSNERTRSNISILLQLNAKHQFYSHFDYFSNKSDQARNILQFVHCASSSTN